MFLKWLKYLGCRRTSRRQEEAVTNFNLLTATLRRELNTTKLLARLINSIIFRHKHMQTFSSGDGWLNVIFAPLKVLMNDANWSGGEKLTLRRERIAFCCLRPAHLSFHLSHAYREAASLFDRQATDYLDFNRLPQAEALETKCLARVCLPLTWSDWIFEIFVRRFLSLLGVGEIPREMFRNSSRLQINID